MAVVYLFLACLEAVEVALVIVGIIALVRGKVGLVGRCRAEGMPARIIGVIFLLMLPLSMAGRYLVESRFQPAAGRYSYDPGAADSRKLAGGVAELLIFGLGVTAVIGVVAFTRRTASSEKLAEAAAAELAILPDRSFIPIELVEIVADSAANQAGDPAPTVAAVEPAVPADVPAWLQQFVKGLGDHSILNRAEAWPAVQKVPAAERGSPQQLAQALARQGKLTWFQAALLSQGKAEQLVLGNYVLLDKVGQGGFGTVFKARHRRMQRVVALKVLLPELVRDPQVLQRFQREVETAARLIHPNIVTAYDADETRGAHFLAMEFVDGPDLARLLKKQGPVPPERALDYILQAARGLAHAHAAGVIHRDVKPNNLLLNRDGVVKVSDLGLARIVEVAPGSGLDALTGSRNIMGTVDYMSPEQALNSKNVDSRADIYSLGCTLYTLLTAQPVYSGGSAMEIFLAHREKPIPQLPSRCAALQDIFARMIAKRPEDRYSSMPQLIAALEQHRAPTAVSAAIPAAVPVPIPTAVVAVLPVVMPAVSSVSVPSARPIEGGKTVATSQATPSISREGTLASRPAVPLAGKRPETTTATTILSRPLTRKSLLLWCVGGGVAALVVIVALVAALAGRGKTDTAEQASAPGTASVEENQPVDLHAQVRECVKEGKVGKTNVIGGAFANQDFEELPADGGILIGFEVGTGKFVSNDTIGYLRPIYQLSGGEKVGKEYGKRPDRVVTLKAKAGYAVGGMRIGAGGVMDGLAVTFMRQKGKFLDVTDAYESQWVGGQGGGTGTRIGGDGSVMIGILGKTLGDGQPGRLGLIYPRVPTGWIVIFRSDDPSIWNDDIDKGPNHFAKALSLVPDTIRCLKLTNTATREFVVLEMTKQQLTAVTDDGRYGWEGRNEFHYRVYHLGIFSRIWPAGDDGDVIITRHGPARGWGFGDTWGHEGKQGYGWGGKPIPRTVFEIAVTAGDLTPVEAKKLLKAGVLRE